MSNPTLPTQPEEPVVPASASTPEQVPASPPAPPVPAYGEPVYGAPAAPPAAPASKKNGLGLAAVILGAVAFLFAFIPGVNFFAIILALVGVVLGAIGLAQKNKVKTLALIGTILSGVAAVLAIIMIVVYAAVFVKAVDDSLPDTEISAPAEAAEDEPAEEPVAEEPAAAEVGTRENPAALGTTITIESGGTVEWEVTPGLSALNANDAIAAENQFNEVPPAGMQWAMLPVTFTYKGSDAGTPWVAFQVKFVGADGNTYESYDPSAVTPSGITSVNEMYAGATAVGNVAIMIPTAAAEQGTWVIEPTLFGDPFFFKAQ